MLMREGLGRQSGRSIGCQGFADLRQDLNLAVHQRGRAGVETRRRRKIDLLGEPLGGLKDLRRGLAVAMAERLGGKHLPNVEDLEEEKVQVSTVDDVCQKRAPVSSRLPF